MPDNNDTEPRSGALRRVIAAHLMRVVVILLLILAAGWLVLFWNEDGAHPVPHAAPAPAAVEASVLTLAAERVPLEPDYLGQTEASRTVEIRARVDGFLEAQHFTEGTKVEAGQPLFLIDPRVFQTELDIARAALASAKARTDRAQRQVVRFRELTAQQAATPSELEEWETELALGQAEIALAEARIARAELDLSYTEIVSPITGVIGEAERDVGSYVGPQDGGLLAVVEQHDPMHVRFSVSESDILRWARDQATGVVESPAIEELQIELTLSDGSVHPHRGRIEFLGVRVDPSTGSTVVQAVVPNPDLTLLPGQFCHARVIGPQRVGAILVPQSALVQNPSGTFVYTLGEGDAAELRAVTIGDWIGGRVVVTAGLAPGDRVVTDRLMTVRPGVTVKPIEPTPPADAPAPPAPHLPGAEEGA